MAYESAARVSTGAMISMDVPPPNSASTQETLDFLCAEMEILDKTTHELHSRLGFFLEPEGPEVNSRDPEQLDRGSELNCRLKALARKVIAIRQQLNRMAKRAN